MFDLYGQIIYISPIFIPCIYRILLEQRMFFTHNLNFWCKVLEVDSFSFEENAENALFQKLFSSGHTLLKQNAIDIVKK